MNITCQERPYRSCVHPYFSLNGYSPSSISAVPRRTAAPKGVHLLLRFAGDEEGDGGGEFEDRPAVQADESLPLELELDGHQLAFGLAVEFESGFPVEGSFPFWNARKAKYRASPPPPLGSRTKKCVEILDIFPRFFLFIATDQSGSPP